MRFIHLFFVSLTLFLCLTIRQCLAQINWLGGDEHKSHLYALNCDFVSNDFKNVSISGDKCGNLCFNTPPCTHFVWTEQSRTCWLKTTLPPFTEDFKRRATEKPNSLCGFLHTSSWDTRDNWAYNCKFNGTVIKQHSSESRYCGSLCGSNENCTHFTWRYQHKPQLVGNNTIYPGTCLLQTGGASKGQEMFSPNGVCGFKISTTNNPLNQQCTCECENANG